MSGASVAVTLAAALIGGGVAYLIWALIMPWFVKPSAPDQIAGPTPAPLAEGTADPEAKAPQTSDRPEVPHFPDPTIIAQIAAVRTDVAELARAQIAMLEGMANRESQLLNEMRAAASVRDPEMLNSLQRIEARLSDRPPPESGIVLEEQNPLAGEEDDSFIGRA